MQEVPPVDQVSRSPRIFTALALSAIALLCASSLANANASHASWPDITGVLLMNKSDQSRPLDARPGHDPFHRTDSSYSCNGRQLSAGCFPASWWRCRTSARARPLQPRMLPQSAITARVLEQACPGRSHLVVIVNANSGHNELLGGHGDNTIYAGPNGDVIWGDFKPTGALKTQVNHLYGGPGRDIIYAAHGTNYIYSGGGSDLIHAHYGHGVVHCQSAHVHVIVSHSSRGRYHLIGCHWITFN